MGRLLDLALKTLLLQWWSAINLQTNGLGAAFVIIFTAFQYILSMALISGNSGS